MVGTTNLNAMINAARKAGRGLLEDFAEVEHLQVSVKGPGDFVSRADRQAEQTIYEMLHEAHPTYGFLGEEGGAVAGEDPTRRWIVDPLDGTSNYLHGLPHWAVSIAIEHESQIVAGVVHDPVKNETFWAEKGEGAWLNESRLRVSGRSRLIDCLFGASIPFGAKKTLPAMLADLARLMPECAGVRRLGSAALDLAYVAAGRLDGYWQHEVYPWDMAAGMLIVTEAGGFVGPIHEGHSPMEHGDIIAANPNIFDTFAKVIRSRG